MIHGQIVTGITARINKAKHGAARPRNPRGVQEDIVTNAVDTRLDELTDDEIGQVTGGAKKTTKADTARKFEELVRENTVTDAEYWKVG